MHLSKLQVQKQFGRSAPTYDAVAGMQRSIVNQLADRVSISPNNVLDLGCGTGYALKHFGRMKGVELTGLDLANGMLDESREAAPTAFLVQGDIERLPLKSDSYDLSFSASAIQWCDLDTAIGEITRVTRPGGQVLLSTFLEGTLSEWRRLWQVSKQMPFVTSNDLQQAMVRHGLVDVSISVEKMVQRFDSFAAAVGSIRRLGAATTGSVPQSGLVGKLRYGKVRTAIEEEIARHGYYEMPYLVGLASAKKVG